MKEGSSTFFGCLQAFPHPVFDAAQLFNYTGGFFLPYSPYFLQLEMLLYTRDAVKKWKKLRCTKNMV